MNMSTIQTRLYIKNGELILITTPPPKTKPNYTPKTCKWCNKIFTPRTPHQLYCSDSCSYYSGLEYANQRKRRYRKRYKNTLHETETRLGCGRLHEHRNPDFKEEYKKILLEFKHLKLKH